MATPSQASEATTSPTYPCTSGALSASDSASSGVSPGLLSAPLSAATLASRSVLLAPPGARPQPFPPAGGAASAANADVSMCATDGGDLEADGSSVGDHCSSVLGEGPSKITGSCEGVDVPSQPVEQPSKSAPAAGGRGEGNPQPSIREKTKPKADLSGHGVGKRKSGTDREGPDGCRPTCMSISAEDRDRLLLETGVTLEEAEERWWKGYFHDQEVLAQLGKSGLNTLADWFHDAAIDAGERPFLVCPDENISLSYRHVNECVNAVAVWAHYHRRGEGTLEASLHDPSGCPDVSSPVPSKDPANPGLEPEVAKGTLSVSGGAEGNASAMELTSRVRPEGRARDEQRMPGKEEAGRRQSSGGSWEILPSPLGSRDAFDCASLAGTKEGSAGPEESVLETPDLREDRQVLREGATVAVFMSRRVECLVTVLGLTRARLAVALIPTYLREASLMRALAKAKPTCVFVDQDMLPSLRELYSMAAETDEDRRQRKTQAGPGRAVGTGSRRDKCPALFPVFVYGEWEFLRSSAEPRKREPFRERDLLAEIRQAISTCVSPVDYQPKSPAAETDRKALSSLGCSSSQRMSSKLLLPPRSPSLSVVFNLPCRSFSSAPLCWACLEPGDFEACRDEKGVHAPKTDTEKREAGDFGGLSPSGNTPDRRSPCRVCPACGSQPRDGGAEVPALYLYVSVPETVSRTCKGSSKTVLHPLGCSQTTAASSVKQREGLGKEKGCGDDSEVKTDSELELLYPVRLNHKTVIAFGVTWSRHMSLTADDVVYCPLPLEGETGGLAVVAAAIQARARLVLPSDSRSSSGSLFWSDIATFGCTFLAYSADTWPTLFDAEGGRGSEVEEVTHLPVDDAFSQGPREKAKRSVGVTETGASKGETSSRTRQRLRGCIGEGMTAYTWKRLKEAAPCLETFVECHFRPHLPTGTPLANSLGKMGACGFVPNSVQGKRGSARLVRFDETKQEAVRSKDTGRCLEPEMESTEVKRRGEAVVRVDGNWLGFADEEITNAMLYRDAFHPGDAWCRSGDLMDVDRMGFFYFVARLILGAMSLAHTLHVQVPADTSLKWAAPAEEEQSTDLAADEPANLTGAYAEGGAALDKRY